MNQATRVYSIEKGYFSEILEATDLKSQAHARKLAPFVDENRDLLYWVGWGAQKKNGKPRVAHFRHYPRKSQTIKKIVSDEVKLRKIRSGESKKHYSAKISVLELLKDLLSQKKHLPWAFNDPEISEFSMSGDFLAGAISIEKEYEISTPLGTDYRLDIAILGKTIMKKPILLAGIEIEFTHKFGFTKSLICKSLGFPLISIDITDVDLKDINIEWAKKMLMETKRNSSDGFRRNYIYIHRMLATIYLDIPRKLKPESKHQYIIFTKDQDKFLKLIRVLKDSLKLSDKQIIISPVTDKNKQLHVQVTNAGNLSGENWRDHNPKSFIQLTTEKPCTKAGDLYYFHLILAFLCNSHFDCLVGYKYELGKKHNEGDPLYWKMGRKVDGNHTFFQVAPKRLSEPVHKILEHVNKINS